MIYQHRQVIVRHGRLETRHRAFQAETLAALDDHGSVLIGAWEVWIGPEAGCAVYQLRQFESLADWEQHQEKVRQDSELAERRETKVHPYNDFVDTSIVRMADGADPLPETWPAVDAVRGQPCGYIEQRILTFRPDKARDHHKFYFAEVAPALEHDWRPADRPVRHGDRSRHDECRLPPQRRAAPVRRSGHMADLAGTSAERRHPKAADRDRMAVPLRTYRERAHAAARLQPDPLVRPPRLVQRCISRRDEIACEILKPPRRARAGAVPSSGLLLNSRDR